MNPPSTIASDTLVEAIARAIEPCWFGETDGKHPLDNFPDQHKVYQHAARTSAQAALTAITEAGYAVVPVEPTKAMQRDGGQEYAMTHQRPNIAEANARAIYRAMLKAGTHLRFEEGE